MKKFFLFLFIGIFCLSFVNAYWVVQDQVNNYTLGDGNGLLYNGSYFSICNSSVISVPNIGMNASFDSNYSSYSVCTGAGFFYFNLTYASNVNNIKRQVLWSQTTLNYTNITFPSSCLNNGILIGVTNTTYYNNASTYCFNSSNSWELVSSIDYARSAQIYEDKYYLNMIPVINNISITPSIAFKNDSLQGFCGVDSNVSQLNYIWYKNGVLNVSGSNQLYKYYQTLSTTYSGGMGGINIIANGSKLYYVQSGSGTNKLYQYDLSTPNDISTASLTNTINPFGSNGLLQGLFFSNNGSYMYVTDDANNVIKEYLLSSPFDISTASNIINYTDYYLNSVIHGLSLNNNGTKLFIIAHLNSEVYIRQYNFSIPYNISSMTFIDSVLINDSWDIKFSSNGMVMFLASANPTGISVYDLNSPYDVSSLVYRDLIITTSYSGSSPIYSMTFSNDSSKLFYADDFEYMIYQWNINSYTLNTSYKVANFSNSFVKNDNITFGCNAFDGISYSGWSNTSVLIQNSVSVIVSSRLSPLVAFKNTTIQGFCNASDVDGDTLTYNYSLYLNNVLNFSNQSGYTQCFQESANVSNQTGTDGICSLNYSGYYTFSTTVSGMFTNQNNLIDGLTNTFGECSDGGAPHSGACSFNAYYVLPPNVDNVTWNIFFNSVPNQSILVPKNCISSGIVHFWIRKSLVLTNTFGYCYNNSGVIELFNVTDNMFSEENINYTIRDYNQSVEQNVFNLSNIVKNINVTLQCQAFDGLNYSGALNSSVLTIQNSLPIFNQSNFYVVVNHTQNISLQINASDLDGDFLNFSMVTLPFFFINSSTGLITKTNDVSTVGNYNASINVSDGQNVSLMWVFFEILNNAPILNLVSSVNISHAVNLSFQTICSDVDNDSLYYYVNNSLVSINASGFLFDNPLQNETGSYNINVSCGDSNLNASQVFVYTVYNNVPVASVLILGKPLVASQNLSINLSYSDLDNDSIILNQTKWFVNDVYNSSFDNISFINSSYLMNGLKWTVSAKVFDGLSWSDWVNDSVVLNDTVAPTINSLFVSSNSVVYTDTLTLYANLSDTGGFGVSACIFTLKKSDFDGGKGTGVEFNISPTTDLSNGVVSIPQNMIHYGVGVLQWSKAYCSDFNGNVAFNGSVNINVTISSPSTPPSGGGGGSTSSTTTVIASNQSTFSVETDTGSKYAVLSMFPSQNRSVNLVVQSLVSNSQDLKVECVNSAFCSYVRLSKSSLSLSDNGKGDVVVGIELPEGAVFDSVYNFDVVVSDSTHSQVVSVQVQVSKFARWLSKVSSIFVKEGDVGYAFSIGGLAVPKLIVYLGVLGLLNLMVYLVFLSDKKAKFYVSFIHIATGFIILGVSVWFY